jgi:hypothetical protein
MSLKDFESRLPKLRELAFQYLVKGLYASGSLTDNDIRNEDSLLKATDKIIKKLKITGIVYDHTGTLVSQAEYFYSNSRYDYSRIFYATFFEHCTNQIVELYCRNNKLNDNTRIEIIKSVNIYGKLTWFLELTDLPHFNKKYIKIIKNLADERNAFIHFKWNSESDIKVVPSNMDCISASLLLTR